MKQSSDSLKWASQASLLDLSGESLSDISMQYFLNEAKNGDKIRIGHGISATLRHQYDNRSRRGDIGIELIIGDLIVAVSSSDTEDTCSLFNIEDKFYNIRGDGYIARDGGVYLKYIIGVTDPETSPCRNHPIQRDPGMRLD